jgi:hypothetical protein
MGGKPTRAEAKWFLLTGTAWRKSPAANTATPNSNAMELFASALGTSTPISSVEAPSGQQHRANQRKKQAEAESRTQLYLAKRHYMEDLL